MTEESEKYMCPKPKVNNDCKPPNMRTIWNRLPEVFADDTCGNKLSAIRWLLIVIGWCILLYTINTILTGKCDGTFWPSVAAIVSSLMAGYAVGKWKKGE